MFLLSSKNIPDLYEFHKAIKLLVPEFDGLLVEGNEVWVNAPIEFVSQIEAIIPPSKTQLEQVKIVIQNAMNFGNGLIMEFAAENVAMGITQDGMTGVVRRNCSQVIDCLLTGSLYDAIIELRAIPEDKKDAKYLTNARLLIFINKIETYLGIPLSTGV